MKAILLVWGFVGGVVVGSGGGWLVEWKRVCWIGLDELDDERKLGWRAMEMCVLIPVGRSLWGGG
jgi:hypothetical protein